MEEIAILTGEQGEVTANMIEIRAVTQESLSAVKQLIDMVAVSPLTGQTIPEVADELFEDVCKGLRGENGQHHFIAIAEIPQGKVLIGILGYAIPYLGDADDPIREFVLGASVEIHNAYVHPDVRGIGVMTSLINHITAIARIQGVDQLVLRSGYMFSMTGWPYWDKRYEYAGYVENYYAPREEHLGQQAVRASEPRKGREKIWDAQVWVGQL